MLFSSLTFLYFFLPAVLIAYFLSPNKFKNFILMMFSFLFYGWGEPKYIVLMLLSVTAGYVFGLLIEKWRGTKKAKVTMIISVIFNLCMIGYFKYANFFIDNFNAVTGLSYPLLKVALPIGISFYTFQILSYTIDVYRGDTKAQRNIVSLAMYISFFPQLIAGPIVRYADIEKQLNARSITVDKFSAGISRFIVGLSKKILVANSLGELCDIFKLSSDKSVLFFWLYALAFSLHIYFDFSGYSDMAIGLGKLFGFEFIENFNYPFISRSITEFWRRWHMSLGTWFRDYVYIPLGGNRVSPKRHIMNILIVWFLTGAWHGASWNFIIWGLYFACFLILEKKLLLDKLNNSRILCHIYTCFVVGIGFVVFNAANMREAVDYLLNMFAIGDLPLISDEFVYYLRNYAVVLAMAMIGSTPVVKRAYVRMIEDESLGKIFRFIEPILLVIALLMCTANLVDGSFNPFLYFRF